MTASVTYYSQFTVDSGQDFVTKFENINDRDGFEISLGMYRGNLGPITEEVLRRFADKFNGEVLTAAREGEQA